MKHLLLLLRCEGWEINLHFEKKNLAGDRENGPFVEN